MKIAVAYLGINIVDYVPGAESMQLTRAEFEEWGEAVAERLKLPKLIVLLSKPATYTILILSLIHISEPTRPY